MQKKKLIGPQNAKNEGNIHLFLICFPSWDYRKNPTKYATLLVVIFSKAAFTGANKTYFI